VDETSYGHPWLRREEAISSANAGSYTERFECLEEERFASGIVAHSEFDVVKHEFSPLYSILTATLKA